MSLRACRRADLPRFPGWKIMFGPGLVWAALARGTGELIFGPAFSAKYGAWFLSLAGTWLFYAGVSAWYLATRFG